MNPLLQILIGCFFIITGYFAYKDNKKNPKYGYRRGLYADATAYPYFTIIGGIIFIIEAFHRLLNPQ